MIDKIKGKILRYFEKWFLTKELKSDFIYMNKEEDVIVMLESEEETISLFVRGVLYKIPIITLDDEHNQELDDAITRITDTVRNINAPIKKDIKPKRSYKKKQIVLHTLSTDDLVELLKDYERLEEYGKCAEIKKILESR